MTDNCNATAREKGKLLICVLHVGHAEDHDDGAGHTWRNDRVDDDTRIDRA